MYQAVILRPLTAEARVRARDSPCGIVVYKLALELVFIRALRVVPVSIIPPWLSILVDHLADEQ
jgi:hypothetical protein